LVLLASGHQQLTCSRTAHPYMARLIPQAIQLVLSAGLTGSPITFTVSVSETERRIVYPLLLHHSNLYANKTSTEHSLVPPATCGPTAWFLAARMDPCLADRSGAARRTAPQSPTRCRKTPSRRGSLEIKWLSLITVHSRNRLKNCC
jgi:hypothetical protein